MGMFCSCAWQALDSRSVVFDKASSSRRRAAAAARIERV
jgi:hypothetical protein